MKPTHPYKDLEQVLDRFAAYLRASLGEEFEKRLEAHLRITRGKCSMRDLLRFQNLWSQSEKGKLGAGK